MALATCAALPQLADDEPLLLDGLRARGISAEPVVWDADDVDWSAYALVVIRCTWDYSERRDQFLGWAESLPRVLNPVDVIRWNTDKRYLAEVPNAVTTEFVAPGRKWAPPGGSYVVKPTVSSGSRDTARYGPGDGARAIEHVERLLRERRQVMVQPYLEGVEDRGETALVFIGGEYSHAIRKGPMLAGAKSHASGLYIEEEISPRSASEAERRVAGEVLDALRWRRDELLYARVDLIPGPGGDPTLIELELTEPSLYLSYGDRAAERLADQIAARL